MNISPDVLRVLEGARTDGNALTLTGQLDRKTYVKVNEVLEAAGGKWNRKAKAHIFAGAADAVLAALVGTGEVDCPKEDFDFYETPPEVVARMLELAQIEPGHTVLEPSAGRGGIAVAVVEATDGDAILDVVEIHNDNHVVLMSRGLASTCTNFLTMPPVARYDRIVMNPPFSKRQDVAHVAHARRFLREGGRLVAIMSAGLTFRKDKATSALRGAAVMIEALPAGSFKSSGTNVNAVIAVFLA